MCSVPGTQSSQPKVAGGDVFTCLNEDGCAFPTIDTAFTLNSNGAVRVMDMIGTIQLLDFAPWNGECIYEVS